MTAKPTATATKPATATDRQIEGRVKNGRTIVMGGGLVVSGNPSHAIGNGGDYHAFLLYSDDSDGGGVGGDGDGDGDGVVW